MGLDTPGRRWPRQVSDEGAVNVRHEVTVPYTVEQDEDGVWVAHAQLRPGVGANGSGDTPDEAVADLRDALTGLIESFGVPKLITVTVEMP
jgi:predicted RNase H-like HicB family nuclease